MVEAIKTKVDLVESDNYDTAQVSLCFRVEHGCNVLADSYKFVKDISIEKVCNALANKTAEELRALFT